MGLLSFIKRQPSAAREPADPAEAVQRARTNARRRLMGAVLLLGVGVIGFPLLFETQPRPIAVDIPIDIPRKEGAAPLEVPVARAPTRPVAPPAEPAPDTVVTEKAGDAGREVAPPAASQAASRPTAAASAQKERERPAPAPEPAAPPAAAPQKPATPAPATRDDTQRARALLEGRAAEPAGARFVVQVGAFADANAVREARAKVEKLGLKTYTQVVDTSAGKRTRVRVGPFDNREDADKASSRIRSAGLAPAVLTL